MLLISLFCSLDGVGKKSKFRYIFVMSKNLFKLRKFGWLTPTHQIVLLILVYLASIGVFYWEWKTTGRFLGTDNTNWIVIFAPFYEEALFRGLLLGGFLSLYNESISIWLSGFLFGLWHLKNFATLEPFAVIYQVLYTGLVLGPLLAWVACRTKSIWMGVLIHEANNILLSPVSWWIVGMFGYKDFF